ncbi:PREDICTED: galanin receptor type 1-like isoform X2 [Priapulus caudatus]|nr:PREDICTED: galanin receptor type 1-like isoform X2 [Priapulus caudatus]
MDSHMAVKAVAMDDEDICLDCTVVCLNCSITGPQDVDYDYINYSSYAGDGQDRIITITLPLVFSLIFLVGLASNGLVLYVVLCSRSMRTITSLYLVNLAVADLILLVFCVPFITINYLLPYWPFGQIVCKVWTYLTTVAVSASVMTLIAMAVDRYYAVVQPVRSLIFRTVQRTVVILTVIWMTSFIGLAPVLFIMRVAIYFDRGEWQEYCVEHWQLPSHRTGFTVVLFIAFYVAPLIVITSTYVLMARSLCRTVSPIVVAASAGRMLTSRTMTARTLLVIVAVFAVCWLPAHCVQLSHDAGTWRYTEATFAIKALAHTLSYCNSALNPFIYAFMTKSFRESAREVFSRRKHTDSKVFVITEQD